jgi:hypothetical protein
MASCLLLVVSCEKKLNPAKKQAIIIMTVGAGFIPISAKLFFAEKAEKMNIEHRTSNIE